MTRFELVSKIACTPHDKGFTCNIHLKDGSTLVEETGTVTIGNKEKEASFTEKGLFACATVEGGRIQPTQKTLKGKKIKEYYANLSCAPITDIEKYYSNLGAAEIEIPVIRSDDAEEIREAYHAFLMANIDVFGVDYTPRDHITEWHESIESNIDSKLAGPLFDGETITPEDVNARLKEIGKEASDSILDDEEDPVATITFKNSDVFEDDRPYGIGYYGNETDEEFTAKYHRTDAWRGYYEVESDNWVEVWDDNILSYSEDAAELKKFDEDLSKIMDEQNIPYARAIARSSNLFSSGYTLFVPKEHAADMKAIASLLALKYRDPERYSFTALTGKDPSEATPSDKLFVDAAERVFAGEDAEKIMAEIKEKIGKGITE